MRDQAENILHEVGVSADIVRIAPAGAEPAKQILKARQPGVDALVMDAYRHSEAIEWTLEAGRGT